jgi:hypothetical protein
MGLSRRHSAFLDVIPAKAGIQGSLKPNASLREVDGEKQLNG